MLLSAAAYDALASRLLGPECPLLAFNDLTILGLLLRNLVKLPDYGGMYIYIYRVLVVKRVSPI